VEDSDGESDWSGLGGRKDRGWRQEISFALEDIKGLLRDQMTTCRGLPGV